MKENIPKGRITFINEVLCKYDPAGTTSPDSDEYLTEATDISKNLWKALGKDGCSSYPNPPSPEEVVYNVILGVLLQKFGFRLMAVDYSPSFREDCVNKESIRLAAKEILDFLGKK